MQNDKERIDQLEEAIFAVSIMLAEMDRDPSAGTTARQCLRVLGKVMDDEACKRFGI